MKTFTSKQIFLVIFATLFFLEAKAQSDFRPGYIITLQGDTVNGLINFGGDKANAKRCFFKTQSKQKAEIYTPDQIKSYQFIDGNYYISSNILNCNLNDPQFLEYIFQGNISFLYYADETKDHYFASKDSSIVELDHRIRLTGIAEEDNKTRTHIEKFKGQLKLLMQDQPSIFEEIDKIDCNSKDLISIASKYQKITFPSLEGIKYEKKTGKNKAFKLGLFFSSGLSNQTSPPYNMYISDYTETKSLDFKTAFTYEVGTTIDCYFNHNGRYQFGIQLSPAINIVEYKSNVKRPLAPLLYVYNANIKFTTLKLPVLLKYSFYNNTRPIIPFIKAGPGCAVYLNSKGQYEYYSTPLSNPSKPQTTFTKPLNNVSGSARLYFTAGTGLDIRCCNRLLSVGVNYSRGEGQLKGFRSDAQLQIGFIF